MWALFYDFMVAYTMEDMSPAPSLATDWETSEDGLTWTFNIRDDVDWTDGEHLTASDIAFTYNLVLGGGAASNNYSSYLNNVESVTAPDDTTVVLTLSKPNATLPLLPIPIVPEHIWKDVSKDEMKTYQPEPTPGAAARRHRAVHPGRRDARRLRVPLRGQRQLLGRRAVRRRGRVPGHPEQRPEGPGPDQG